MKDKFSHTENYIEDIIPEDIYKYTAGKIKVGDVVEGKVIDITNEGIYVDINSKTDGFVPAEEFSNVKNINKLFKPQQIIKVFVVKLDYDNVHILSYKRAKELEMLNTIKENFDNKTPLVASVISKTNRGYIVDIGVDALLPYNEISNEVKKKIENKQDNLNDVTVNVVIKEFNFAQNKRLNVVVSNKIYEEIVKEQIKEKVFSQLKENDEVVGTVKSLTSFGAFVDINGVDALLHISNIAWYKLNHPQEVLHCGDKIKVKILKIDKENGKISVGLKQLFPHPWEEVDKKYKIGEVVKCKIVNITNFGIFVELEPAVEGLIHISEVSWENKNPDLKKMFKIGQEVEAKILDINKLERKLSLSIKKTKFNPWEDIKKEFPPGSVHKGKITKITPYGLYVSLKPGFEGIVHKTNISWTQKNINLFSQYRVGDTIEYKVLDIFPEQETAELSIKHLKENPFEKYPVDTIVKCKIKKILKNIIICELEKDLDCILTKKEAIIEKKDFDKDLKILYKPGQQINAVVIESNEETGRIEISVRKLEKIIQKQLIKKYSEVKLPTLKDLLTEKEE